MASGWSILPESALSGEAPWSVDGARSTKCTRQPGGAHGVSAVQATRYSRRVEYGPEFDDLRGDYSSVEERLQWLAENGEDGEDGNGRLAAYFVQELDLVEREIELRKNNPNHKPQPVSSAYKLHEDEVAQQMAEDSDLGRPEPL